MLWDLELGMGRTMKCIDLEYDSIKEETFVYYSYNSANLRPWGVVKLSENVISFQWEMPSLQAIEQLSLPQ